MFLAIGNRNTHMVLFKEKVTEIKKKDVKRHAMEFVHFNRLIRTDMSQSNNLGSYVKVDTTLIVLHLIPISNCMRHD